jgi:hypothetical protein
MIAESASALKNGDIISHTIYPERARSPKKKAYSTTLLTFSLFMCTYYHAKNKRPR